MHHVPVDLPAPNSLYGRTGAGQPARVRSTWHRSSPYLKENMIVVDTAHELMGTLLYRLKVDYWNPIQSHHAPQWLDTPLRCRRWRNQKGSSVSSPPSVNTQDLWAVPTWQSRQNVSTSPHFKFHHVDGERPNRGLADALRPRGRSKGLWAIVAIGCH